MAKAILSPVQRFFKHVQKSEAPDGCWIWTASKYPDGYGMFNVDGKLQRAHRFAFEQFVGEISTGMFVCHKCDTPACCNPAHLFLGTQKDNMADCHRKGRTASGKRNGSHTHPERRNPGNTKGTALRGEDSPARKLSAEQVIGIRQRYAQGGVSQRALGAEYGVTHSQIGSIVLGKSWSCLLDDETLKGNRNG